MKKLSYFSALIMTSTLSLSAQTLTIGDMARNIHQFKDHKTVNAFVGKHGFDLDTVLIQNKISKIYSFLSTKEFHVIGLDEDTIVMNNAAFVRIDEDKYLRKLTIMTGVKEYYQQLVVEMVQKKFKLTGAQDRSKPMAYTSELYKDVIITLSVVEALKDDKRYARYQIVTTY